MKISSFIISLILVGVIAVTFSSLTAEVSTKYGIDYDNNTIELFDQSSELTATIDSIKSKEQNLTTKSGILDVVGEYVGKAVDSLRITKQSWGVYSIMLNETTNKLGVPSYFKVALYSIVIILIIIGVIVSAMLKKDV